MKKSIFLAFLGANLILIGAFFSACSDDADEFNKSASYWYEQIIIAVADGNLEKADNFFNSLQNEHSASPLIKDALILLTKEHSEQNEHLLAGFFANEYKTRFSEPKNADYVGFLNIQTNFYAFGNYTKDQGFINENVNEIAAFVAQNQNSKYLPYMRHILTTFKLAQLEINQEIARIYRVKDKEIAQKKYEEKNMDLDGIDFEPSHIPWYVKMFSW
ncbi:outer membrane protein assembly factor BamD [Helicobacter sp. 23-1045]